MCGRVGAHDEAESWENARLIAEAPSLQDKCKRLELENIELRNMLKGDISPKMTVEKFYESIIDRLYNTNAITHWAFPIKIVIDGNNNFALSILLHSTGEKRLITHSKLEEGFSITIRKPDYNVGRAKLQRDASLLTDKQIDEIAQIAVFHKVLYLS